MDGEPAGGTLNGRFCMWCSSCQQDVPGHAAGDGAVGMVCPRCAAALRTVTPAVTTPPWDDAELEADLRLAEKLIRLGAAHRRFDSAEGSRSIPAERQENAIENRHQAERRPEAPTKSTGATVVIWGSGLLLVVGGMAAVTYSTVSHRADFWSLGLSLALAGQAILILGLLLRMELRGRKDAASSAAEGGEFQGGRTTEERPSRTNPGTVRRIDAQSLSQANLDLASLQRQLDLVAYRLQRHTPPLD